MNTHVPAKVFIPEQAPYAAVRGLFLLMSSYVMTPMGAAFVTFVAVFITVWRVLSWWSRRKAQKEVEREEEWRDE